MEGKGRYIILAATAIAMTIIAFFVGKAYGQKDGVVLTQVEAIKSGHAKYVISDELGHTEFHWCEKGDVELKKIVPPVEEKKP